MTAATFRSLTSQTRLLVTTLPAFCLALGVPAARADEVRIGVLAMQKARNSDD